MGVVYWPRSVKRALDGMAYKAETGPQLAQIGQQEAESSMQSAGWQPMTQADIPQPAAPAPLPAVELPSLEEMTAKWAPPKPQQTPTPSGTPAAMPTAPGLTPATITSGPKPGQTLQPGESVGSVTLAGGSNPEKQAEVYQEALAATGGDDEAARILVAVTETEGGLTGAIGDQGQSSGGYQFHEQGQMPGFRAWLQQQGIQGDPSQLVHDHRLTTRYAATTYLGRAIAAGRAQGLRGAELATYVQRHGQVSEHPERTGANYQRLYGPGSQTYPDRGQPAVRENVPTAPLTPPQAGDARTYPEQTVRPMPAPAVGPKLRVVDKWGNEFELTQEQLNKRPGGYADLTILGPVAMNAGAATPPAAMAAPAGPGSVPPAAGAGALHPTVAQKWRQQFGRDPDEAEVAELMSMLGVA